MLPYLSPEDFTNAASALFSRPDEACFGPETAHQARRRFDVAVAEVLRDAPPGNVIVVAHGTVISLLVAHHTGCAAFPLWRRLG
jgi:broad specificity phosphatase PhoE